MEELVNLFHGFAVALQPFNIMVMVLGIALGFALGRYVWPAIREDATLECWGDTTHGNDAIATVHDFGEGGESGGQHAAPIVQLFEVAIAFANSQLHSRHMVAASGALLLLYSIGNGPIREREATWAKRRQAESQRAG
jgi:hypothetical protein